MSGRSNKRQGDPRGHSARVYDDIYDSPAFQALSPHDVMAYLALLRDLRATNNGNLALPLSVAKHRGIKHKTTLARSLRALRSVGLIAITRRGGSDRGGHRLPSLYRLTDIPSSAFPKLFIDAMPATNEWKRVGSVAHGQALIEQAEAEAKKSPGAGAQKMGAQGHAISHTGARREPIASLTGARHEPWQDRPGHIVNLGEMAENPATTRDSGRFHDARAVPSHGSPDSPPFALLPSLEGELTRDEVTQ